MVINCESVMQMCYVTNSTNPRTGPKIRASSSQKASSFSNLAGTVRLVIMRFNRNLQ